MRESSSLSSCAPGSAQGVDEGRRAAPTQAPAGRLRRLSARRGRQIRTADWRLARSTSRRPSAQHLPSVLYGWDRPLTIDATGFPPKWMAGRFLTTDQAFARADVGPIAFVAAPSADPERRANYLVFASEVGDGERVVVVTSSVYPPYQHFVGVPALSAVVRVPTLLGNSKSPASSAA